MPWPIDPRHDYAVWLEESDDHAKVHGYVTAHPKTGPDGRRTRFAARLDLSGDCRTRPEAEREAFAIAERFCRGEISPPAIEIAEVVREYRVIGGARFRIDRRQWEPVLKLKSKRPANKGAIQVFDEMNSPFHLNTFASAETAARFALSYGERMVLGLVGGLRI